MQSSPTLSFPAEDFLAPPGAPFFPPGANEEPPRLRLSITLPPPRDGGTADFLIPPPDGLGPDGLEEGGRCSSDRRIGRTLAALLHK